MHEPSLDRTGVTTNSAGGAVAAFLKRGLDGTGTVANPAKSVVLRYPRRDMCPEGVGDLYPRLEIVDVRIAEAGGVTLVGVPIRNR